MTVDVGFATDYVAMDIPLLASVALARGELTRNDLRTRYRHVFRDVYISRDADMVVRRYQLTDDEVCLAKSMRVTTPARTAFDLGRRLTMECGVQHLDALLNATLIEPAEVAAIAQRHPGARGLRQLDGGAESPEWVGVDFEGKHHWTDPRQRDWDVERYAKLPELGWIDIRATARILHNRRQDFLIASEAR